jgi:hypothetical protein
MSSLAEVDQLVIIYGVRADGQHAAAGKTASEGYPAAEYLFDVRTEIIPLSCHPMKLFYGRI